MTQLAAVRDLREHRPPASAEELEEFETDVLAGFVLARAAAGLADGTIRGEVGHLEQVRAWFGRPLWEMEPADADAYFGRVLRGSPKGTRLAQVAGAADVLRVPGAAAQGRDPRHDRPGGGMPDRRDEPAAGRQGRQAAHPARGRRDRRRCSPAGREDLASCRKFAPTARNYTAAKLMADVGLRVNEARNLDLADVKWELGRFGKLHVRMGKGARGSGPRERMVPLINGAGRTLRWFIEDVWGQFDDDHTRHGAPLFPSERKNADGLGRRVGYDALRAGVADAAAEHLPAWTGRLTPHVLRHYCASQLYLDGMDLISIQEMLGHAWVATTMRYVHVHRTRIEDAWMAGQNAPPTRLEGLV